MILITCVDDKMGMLFNKRRQSMDSILRERVLKMCAGKKLWMNEYSRKQFDAVAEGISVDEDFMTKAGEDDYCFAENISPKAYEGHRLTRTLWQKRAKMITALWKTSAPRLTKGSLNRLCYINGTGFTPPIYILIWI